MTYDHYLFDLDNTLYDESEYLYAAYEKIAYNQHELETLLKIFVSEGKEFLFQKFNRKILIERPIESYLEILRTVKAPIMLFDWVKPLFDRIGLEKIVITTNGNVQQQKNKLKLLGLHEYKVIHTIKPETKWLDAFRNTNTLMVGDSKEDQICARLLGIDFLPSTEIGNLLNAPSMQSHKGW